MPMQKQALTNYHYTANPYHWQIIEACIAIHLLLIPDPFPANNQFLTFCSIRPIV